MSILKFLLFIPSLILIAAHAIDYEDNDLAKVCRPIDRQLDLLFVLDGSGSVSGTTFATQMQMLNRIVEMVDIGPEKTQIAVMQYSSYTRVEFGFAAHQDKQSLKSALSKIRYLSGTTKTGKALDKALNLFKHDATSGARLNQEDVAQVAVVVTDGHSHDDPVPAAQKLRQGGVQILALGIGAHINMGELFDITGDDTLAFQNLTSQSSLDQFVNQFKKIAVGELCKFARGAHGAEINCNSDSIDIRVSTVNPFYGHLYVANQFRNVECVARASNLSTEVYLSLNLTSCNIQKQSMINPKGVMFETVLVLKFHPSYNTEKDKVFNVQCFYPEKAAKLPQKLADNRIAISDTSQSMKMPCSYKVISKSANQCKLEDMRVGETIVHSWECDKSVFDTYQSMLIHSCVISDGNGKNNRTVVDKDGCSIDSAVLQSPDYVEPLTAFAVGKSVKFPDSSLVRFSCKLRFCDRLLNECDDILPPRCNKKKIVAEELNANNVQFSLRVKKQAGQPVGVKSLGISDDSEYEEIAENQPTTSIPIVTFSPFLSERRGPPHRRRPVLTRPHPDIKSDTVNSQLFPLSADVPTSLEPPATATGHIASIRPLITNGRLSDGQPKLIQFPVGGLDVKLNTQDVAIISNDAQRPTLEKVETVTQKTVKPIDEEDKVSNEEAHADTQHEKDIENQMSDQKPKLKVSDMLIKTSTPRTIADKRTRPLPQKPTKIPTEIKIIARSKGAEVTEKFTILTRQKAAKTEVANANNAPLTSLSTSIDDPFQSENDSAAAVPIQTSDDKKEQNELVEEYEPAVRLDSDIAKTVRADEMSVESQVLTVRDLEIVLDLYRTQKWCPKS